jgi:hypothetical protein
MRSLPAPLRPGCLPRPKTRKAPLWVTLRRSTSRSPRVLLGWSSPEADAQGCAWVYFFGKSRSIKSRIFDPCGFGSSELPSESLVDVHELLPNLTSI